MDKREKVINALIGCSNIQSGFTSAVYVCPTCLYGRDDGQPCESLHLLMEDALAMLKAQTPRVMTLDEVESAYEKQEPVWLDVKDVPVSNYIVIGYRLMHKTRKGHEMAYELIGASIVSEKSYGVSMYGKKWRCWTSRPTEKQREAVKWDG